MIQGWRFAPNPWQSHCHKMPAHAASRFPSPQHHTATSASPTPLPVRHSLPVEKFSPPGVGVLPRGAASASPVKGAERAGDPMLTRGSCSHFPLRHRPLLAASILPLPPPLPGGGTPTLEDGSAIEHGEVSDRRKLVLRAVDGDCVIREGHHLRKDPVRVKELARGSLPMTWSENAIRQQGGRGGRKFHLVCPNRHRARCLFCQTSLPKVPSAGSLSPSLQHNLARGRN